MKNGIWNGQQSQSSSAALNVPVLLRGLDAAFFPLPRPRDVPREEDALRLDARLPPPGNPGSGQSRRQ